MEDILMEVQLINLIQVIHWMSPAVKICSDTDTHRLKIQTQPLFKAINKS